MIIGNSITHYWVENRDGSMDPGWREEMEPAGFVISVSDGTKRVENVLWRVYHGELDGYRAKEVVLMTGPITWG